MFTVCWQVSVVPAAEAWLASRSSSLLHWWCSSALGTHCPVYVSFPQRFLPSSDCCHTLNVLLIVCIVSSCKEVGSYVCLSFCLWITEKLSTDFDQNLWTGGEWPKYRPVRFYCWSVDSGCRIFLTYFGFNVLEGLSIGSKAQGTTVRFARWQHYWCLRSPMCSSNNELVWVCRDWTVRCCRDVLHCSWAWRLESDWNSWLHLQHAHAAETVTERHGQSDGAAQISRVSYAYND